MQKVKVGKPFTFRCGGEELAKVLTYYGYIPDACSTEYKIVCPFHNDLNPSMIVNLTEGNYYCFGCGKSGDAYTFVRELNPKLNDLQSVQKLFKILNSNKVKKLDFSKRVKMRKPNDELYDISWDYYYGLSKINWSENKFDEVVQTRKYMLDRGFNIDVLNKCEAKVTFNKSYPIIFPMLDNGTFKGWVCRTTSPEIEEKRKYLYNEGFSRRDTLVGNYGKKDYVIIVEGYMDRLKFIQYGEENVVAILGWKMSKEQEIKLKKSGVKYIISALDNDECGRKGTNYLRSIFNNVIRFSYIKNIKDPGQMSKGLFNKMYKKTMSRYKIKHKS
ncbi:MAG: toprim domain-containing protein [Methanobrevibacter sp.]|nr:toprim domain-containing protein [Methanobrevibacter sp.]